MQDIADKLGVSKNAVSLALNGKAGVGEELRQAVLQAAKLLNYAGMGSRTGEANNILIMIPEYIRNDEYFYSRLYWSIEREARARGCNVVTCTVTETDDKSLTLPDLVTALEYRGIILVGIVSREYLRFLHGLGQKLVLVDHYFDDLDIEGVITANVEGSFQITNYLIERGHRDIGFVAPIRMTASFYDRWVGFRKALDFADLPLKPEFCICSSSPLRSLLSSEDEIRALVSKRVASPSAWVCGNDRIAVALLNVLHEQGRKTPEEVSVVGFDDIDLASCVIPKLTTVRVDRDLMGALAVEKLLTLHSGEGPRIRSSIYAAIVERKSVASLL